MTHAYHLTYLIKGFAHTPFYEYPSHMGVDTADAIARWMAFHFCAHAAVNVGFERLEEAPLLTDLSVWVRKSWVKHGFEHIDINYAGVTEQKSRYFQASVLVQPGKDQRSFEFELTDRTLIHQFRVMGTMLKLGNKNLYIQDQFLPQPRLRSSEDEPVVWPRRGLK